jgi:hypothetical protein
MIRFAALACVVLFAPASADAKCARTGLVPTVISPAAAALEEDGGVVVAAVSEMSRTDPDPGDAAVQTGWRFRSGKQLLAPRIDVIAPGLAVYRVKGVDALELEDAKHAALFTGTVSKTPRPPFAAPKLLTVTYSISGRRRNRAVTIDLADPPPAGAVAIVIADAKGKPRSFGRIDGTGHVQVGFRDGSCTTVPNGTVPSEPGDKITVFFVDASGRSSAPSKVTTVGGIHVRLP